MKPPMFQLETDGDPQEAVAQVYRAAGFEVERRVGDAPGTVEWFASSTGFPRVRTYFRVLPKVPEDLARELAELTAICQVTGSDRAIGIVLEGELPEGYEPNLATATSAALITVRQWVLEVTGIATKARELVRTMDAAAAGLYFPRRARLTSGEEVDADVFIARWADESVDSTLIVVGPGKRTTVSHAAWSLARRFEERPDVVTPPIMSYAGERSFHLPSVVVVADARHYDRPPPTRSLLYWSDRSDKTLLTAPGIVVLRLLPPRADEIERWFERHLEPRPPFDRFLAARRASKDFADLSNVLGNLVLLRDTIRALPTPASDATPIEAWIVAVVAAHVGQVASTVSQDWGRDRASASDLEDLALEQFAIGKAASRRFLLPWESYGWLDREGELFSNQLVMHFFLARKIVREVRAGHDDVLLRYQFPREVFLFLTVIAPDVAARLTDSAVAGMEQRIREEAERIAQLGFAHRLNRPVGAMRQHLGEIRDALDREQQAALVRPFARLEEEIDYIERLTEKTRIWEAGPTGTKANVVLRPLVEDELAPLTRRYTEVDTLVEVPSELHVEAISDALHETLHCLLENAFHAVLCSTRATVRRIVVSGSRTGDVIRLEIRDSGDGVNPGDRDRIFEPFNTNKTGGAGKPRGTGLGLAIAKRFVERMGGRIGLDPAHEETCFFIELVAGKEDG
ncbi:sensor histidine kinase [Polyangium mundeleinium]|uniref:histidine kinase n=1 Tax=Polyangium mundeleinium TaxID=2995306 RepID=A0ABT5F6X5_9BACT|nr:HAMP domain-containing sensor histidine kinase [Polyangium mundeleinium]MDC0749863.1 HAMP domain-containing sensor histidine kinase [Polyangium mundeleinium]